MNLQQRLSTRLKEELKTTESEMQVLVCEPKHGPFLGEDEDNEAEVINNFLNSLISSEPHEYNVDETPDEKYYVLESNSLCKMLE